MRLSGDTGAPDVSADPRPHSDLGSLQRRALALLAVVTAIGSTGLAAGAGAPMAGIIVALGDFTALSLVGVTVAPATILMMAFVRSAA